MGSILVVHLLARIYRERGTHHTLARREGITTREGFGPPSKNLQWKQMDKLPACWGRLNYLVAQVTPNDWKSQMSGYNAHYSEPAEREPLESQADAIARLEARRRQLMDDLTLATEEQAKLIKENRALKRVLNDYLELDQQSPEPLCFNEGLEEYYRQLRDLRPADVNFPDHIALKKFLITYHVSHIHEVEVEAGDDIEARFVFEEMYENNQNELPEYHDIDHSIEEVTEL